MESFKTILLAVDQSEQSDRAVLAASQLAQLSGGSVRLLHVQEFEATATRGGVYNIEEPEEVERLLKKEIDVLKQAAVEVVPEIRRTTVGHIGTEIVEAAKSCSADLIVMGSRGRSRVTAMMLGSTAYKVLHLSDRPVLVVR